VPSCSTASLASLQENIALLLAMISFCCSFDLHQINFQIMSLMSAYHLTLQIVSPKEAMNHRRIIKPFTAHPHENRNLCPVQSFIVLRDHQPLVSYALRASLFVHSLQPDEPLATSAAFTWLRLILCLFTGEQDISVHSTNSFLAL
ncbi:hypothetical protein BCV72DRAFT_190388, partial [Rhizopus microsporus var. microsporus]